MQRGLRTAKAYVSIAALAPAVALGCASGDGAPSGGTAPAAIRESRAPGQLLGSYHTELLRSDLPPNPPPELTDAGRRWELTIASSGGVDDEPAFTIANSELGPLKSSRFGIKGDRVLLHRQECAAGGTVRLLENEYGYAEGRVKGARPARGFDSAP